MQNPQNEESNQFQDDPIFNQICQTENFAGAFSMTLDAAVILFCGEFTFENAQLHAPVIHNILLDTKGVLDTNPFKNPRRTHECLKRIVCMLKFIYYY